MRASFYRTIHDWEFIHRTGVSDGEIPFQGLGFVGKKTSTFFTDCTDFIWVGNSNKNCMFTPNFGEDESILIHIFQMGGSTTN